jgi:hypothetical protein
MVFTVVQVQKRTSSWNCQAFQATRFKNGKNIKILKSDNKKKKKKGKGKKEKSW